MNKIEQLTVDTIRVLSAEAIQKANSGHPGLPLGVAPMAYTLWANHMKHNPNNSKWQDRDRFVLSAGHGSMLEYSLLNLFGYGLTIEDLKNFRQFGSLTPGHPEYGHTNGVEITTGPLGQGIANAVGMAIAESHLAAKFNTKKHAIVDHYTYAICGDGDNMEGISSEAASLAGTLGLSKLILMYDSNSISIEGSTDIAFTEDVSKRFEAYGWQVINVEDGNDMDAIGKAIETAKLELNKPTFIKIKTIIGFGCAKKQGLASAHGEPLGEDNITEMKKCMGWNLAPFTVPDEVAKHMEIVKSKLSKKEETWNTLYAEYCKENPKLAKEYELWQSGDLSVDLLKVEELWKFEGKAATRNSSGAIINTLAKYVPNFIGGSADLAPSNKTYMKGLGDFSVDDRNGSNLHFGVREHAMAAIANGIYVHGGLKPFVSTFFVFSDYMKGAMRLSSLMGLPVTYVLTHDSIAVGEDGPTHEPIEHLAALRALPNFNVFRPADSRETAVGWYAAITSKTTPTALILTRQNLPLYAETSIEALKGAYVLKTYETPGQKPDIILMASGSEVEFIYEGAKLLNDKGIKARVISMPCLDLFEAQSKEYKESILPSSVRTRLAVEAAASFGWHKYVGLDGDVISIDRFGASGKAEILYKEFGFTTENVVSKALKLLGK
ncbi:transketolase [Clostridium estertheticum]|uniref:Transketolase n=1 Tax=Clostridium estertheticum subsp. estertheticum TaxID=1552 RepID=A0A1J0GEW7_9CLOT|nr:transketolase [Clostridium estertheticum]APC39520.1 transketolase [Clostridium estertheticum subsp. estertheticum]MBU3072200.1 transketolase [Clostridium estertheticum]MBU3162292.1 transketolase [Clostridium estertheticum]MBX4261468.1 transketolase [Clostridium estertheticum]MBZ9614452.1 transketolase [Clostridium estertheticum subsp. laramiense]